MWRHIVIEGFCFAQDKEYPCGRSAPTLFCLENGHCPHFAYAESNEREASLFVPLHLIIGDRIKAIGEELYWKLHWYFWGRWFFKEKQAEFREYVKTHTAKCLAWDTQLKRAKSNFPKWYAKAILNYEA